jgi:hypothetical protein
MALTLITNPPTTPGPSTDFTDLVLRSNANMLGHGLSIPIFTLTNWAGSTTIPSIAEGSIIEVGGSFYQADADTALTPEGGIIDGTVHIKLIPGAGSPDPLTVVPTLTNDAIPAWDAIKAGWYTSANKYLPFEMIKASAVYTVKSEFIDQNKTIKISSEGDMILSKDLTAVIGNLTTGNITTNNVVAQNMTGQMKWKLYFKTAATTQAAVFTALSGFVPTTGDFVSCVGQLTFSGANQGSITMLERTSATSITLRYIRISATTINAAVYNSGSGSAVGEIEVMSNFDFIT